MGVTIYDIAQDARVSIATVSRVLNKAPRVADETRKRVEAAAARLGYQPHASARSLAGHQPMVVSAVIPMLTNYFFLEVLRGLQDRLADTEYDLLVYSARTMEEIDKQIGRALQRGRSSALLLFSTPIPPDRVRRLRRSGVPAVLVDCYHPDLDSVCIDNEQGGYVATGHLLDQGHRRVGMVLANPKSVPAKLRFDGYLRALRERGMEKDDALIATSISAKDHGFSETDGYAAMRKMLDRTTPDAVFATSDIQALGAWHALKDKGYTVPDDVALVGFDDIQMSKYLGLSTLRQPMYEMGRLAVDKLFLRLKDFDRPTSHTMFSPALLPRGTTGALPMVSEAMFAAS